VPFAGFVMPAIVSVTLVFFAIAHVPPLFASVIVTVVLEVLALAEQRPLVPLVSETVGVAGMVKAELNTTVIVSPAASAPPGFPVLVEKPTVHVATDPGVCGDPLNVTPETPDGSITYGIGSLESSSLNSRNVELPLCESDHRNPTGVMSLPFLSINLTGRIRNPASRPPALKSIDPPGPKLGLSLAVSSFQRQVLTP